MPASVAASATVSCIERLAEESLRRSGDAIGALPEEDHVEIEPEDLLLGELALHAIGDEESPASFLRQVLSSDRNMLRAACIVMVLAPCARSPETRLTSTARSTPA